MITPEDRRDRQARKEAHYALVEAREREFWETLGREVAALQDDEVQP